MLNLIFIMIYKIFIKYFIKYFIFIYYMSCNIHYDDIIFSVYKVSRINNNNIYYVFIGNTDKKIDNILKKLEQRKNITKDEVKILIQYYPNDYMNWVNIVKQKIKIVFLPHKIYIDDTLNEIRKKIFV